MNIKGKFSQIDNVAFRRGNGERGSTLVVVLVMMVTMVTIAIGALKITQTNVASSGAHKKGKQVFYAAEYGLDQAIDDIVRSFENLTVYTTTANSNKSGTPGVSTTYKDNDVYYNTTNPLDRYLYQTVAGNSTIFHFAHTFHIESRATSSIDNSSETLLETIRMLETPLVQYYIFFGGTGNNADLEVLPGPVMNSWGRIHANGDIYIGTNNRFTLRNYDDAGAFSPHSMTAGGEIFTERKNNGSDYGSSNIWVKTDDSQVTDPNPQRMIPNGDITSANEATEEANFNEYVLINEQQYSAPSQTQFFRGDFYENRANNPQNPLIDSMLIVDTPGAGVNLEIWVSRPVLKDVTAEVLAGTMPTGAPAITPPVRDSAGVNTLCDRRENNRWVDWTDIDLSLLHTWYLDHLNNEGLTWAGGGLLVYTSRSDPGTVPFPNNGARLEAIRLVNMGGSTGLLQNTTVATDNPIYIHGHFNDGAGGNTVRGVALVADAVNILSQGFNTKTCAQSHTSIPNPPTTNINAAFFGGNVPTPAGGGNYSGGLENYPRFHERWSGVNCNILGSFINLWTSTQATERWGKGSVYSPPIRNWGWDVRFQNPNFWPPFIPSIFSVERVGFLEG
jgi:hypothetical protein